MKQTSPSGRGPCCRPQATLHPLLKRAGGNPSPPFPQGWPGGFPGPLSAPQRAQKAGGSQAQGLESSASKVSSSWPRGGTARERWAGGSMQSSFFLQDHTSSVATEYRAWWHL